MENNRAREILQRYVEEICTSEEKDWVETWYNQIAIVEEPDVAPEEIEHSMQVIRRQLPQSNRIKQLWPKIAAAAAILIILLTGSYAVRHRAHTEQPRLAFGLTNDIRPGTNGATLTLSTGQVIVLGNTPNGHVTQQGQVAINKMAAGEIIYRGVANNSVKIMQNTLTTQRKEQYKIILADGSAVWLNAASSITFPTAFPGKDRIVTITGEAYFEVAHQANKPFIVVAHGQTVKILGTHFNINSYPDEPDIKTTLLEGSVQVSGNNSFKVIRPGEQAIFKNEHLSVSAANIDEAVAWKNGYFRFNGEKIQSIMRRIARWYDIDVTYEGPVSDEEYSGKVSRSRNISQVLQDLQYYKSVHFKINGRRVTVLQ